MLNHSPRLTFIFILLSVQVTAGFAADAAVVIHQNTLNGFLTAIGPVSGKEAFNVAGIKGDYTWTVTNARIEITPGKAAFTGDASVNAGPTSYGTVVSGEVEVKFDPAANLINVKVTRAAFEVYVKALGAKKHITDVDISKYYQPEFQFAGPQPVQSSVKVSMPDGSVKTVKITTVSHNLKLEQNQLVVETNLGFAAGE